MGGESFPVRPTRLCIGELELSIPTLDVRLSDLDHELIKEAQRIPAENVAGGVERIVSLSDRVWFKVKTGRWRGAVTHLSDTDEGSAENPVHLARWWLGTGGYRRDGDRTDFYAAVTARARQDGRHRGGVCSDRWLPTEWDWKRSELESAVAWRSEVRRIVCELIVRSLRNGKPSRATFRNYSVTALARAEDGDTYLAVGAENIADPKIFAVIIDAVPGVGGESWQPEPGGVLGLTPQPGEVIWSTILPPSVAAQLLEKYPEIGA